MHGVAFSLPLAYAPLRGKQQGFPRIQNRSSLYLKNSRSKCSRSNGIMARLGFEPPPFPLDALEPHMSRQTLEFHWGKHHRGYVENLNKQIVGTELDGLPLEDIVIATYNKGDTLPSFNNAAQAWNHDFFWRSMKPNGGGEPSGDLLKLIKRDFGSYEAFLSEFKMAAATQFGSGWAWLVYKANRLDVGNAVNPNPSEEDNKLMVLKTPNAINPLVLDYLPLLTIDVWEHAYYLDYQNRRTDFISVFIEKLVSWEAVSSRLERAKSTAAERAREERRRHQEEDEDIENREAVEMYLDSESDASGG
ncbi:superoxide dismutase [Fe], chloroplastic [Aristolochia californica]|uniref:superoxide dismutase [Fe], chloroplastic n=1 Tax=Aristolochia californica TaxID=171875 RepID=UPI0035D71C6A